jgi:HPt (histidine-containing phosphotransfer) domain-containing protein
MTSRDEVGRSLEVLWKKYLPTMLSRVESLSSAVKALEDRNLKSDLRMQAAQEAHKLAGSLGTFGLQSASEEALAIESLLAKAAPIQNKQAMELEQRLKRLKHAIENR